MFFLVFLQVTTGKQENQTVNGYNEISGVFSVKLKGDPAFSNWLSVYAVRKNDTENKAFMAYFHEKEKVFFPENIKDFEKVFSDIDFEKIKLEKVKI